MKILVLGADGQLGKALYNESFNFHYKILFFSKEKLDITNFSDVSEKINEINPECVINCAAYTNVEKAESEKEKANLINNLSVRNLATLCKKLEIKLIQLSTDYVFDGKKLSPYNETDATKSINYYGLTKIGGENQILDLNLKGSIIIRTSWLYSDSKNNFVTKILHTILKKQKLNIISDEFGSPTNAYDLAKFILTIIPLLKNNHTEIFHYCNDGICSREEFVQEILNILKLKLKIHSYQNIDNVVKRPKFSALNNEKAKVYFNIQTKDWRYSLNNHLKKIIVNGI